MFEKPNRSGEDFSEEIQAHIELEADRLAADGMDRAEARDAARRAFGNVTHRSERFYESSRWMWLDHLARDIRYAWRQMKSSPASTATVILSLALGIGVNTAAFSLADQALWRALPVEKPEEFVQLDWNGRFIRGGNGWGSLLPYLFYRDLRADNDVFVDLFARSPADVSVSTGDASEPVTVDIVSGGYFSTLGVRPAAGRLIGDSDDIDPDAHPVVVLSYDYWRTRSGARPRDHRQADSDERLPDDRDRGCRGGLPGNRLERRSGNLDPNDDEGPRDAGPGLAHGRQNALRARVRPAQAGLCVQG